MRFVVPNITSTAVKHLAYQPGAVESTSLLWVCFTSGKTYVYGGVSYEKFVGLLTAESVGQAVNEVVKPFHKFAPVNLPESYLWRGL
jgi:hypothetical protein